MLFRLSSTRAKIAQRLLQKQKLQLRKLHPQRLLKHPLQNDHIRSTNTQLIILTFIFQEVY